MLNVSKITVFTILVGYLFTAGCSAPDSAVDSRPNVIVFYTDDMGWGDLGAFGNDLISTPSLDRLAAEGQRWTNFYVPAPVCSPSRAALLTGRYPTRSGLYGVISPVMFPGDSRGIPEAEVTLAEALKDAGYHTGIFGKWHLGDATSAFPTRHGFDYWFGIPYSNDMNFDGRPGIDYLYQLQISGRGSEIMPIYQALIESFRAPDYRDYDVPLIRSACDADGCSDAVIERPVVQPSLTRRLTEEAMSFIRRHRDAPFFVYIPYSMPHLPIFADVPFVGQSAAGPYGDTIEEIDASVGQVRSLLESLDLSEKTLVVFSSDNGPWHAASPDFSGSTGPLRGSKNEVFEGGVRVPTIFWWKDALHPMTVDGIGSVMDIFATALSLAGYSDLGDIDGIDLSETLLKGAASPRSQHAFYRRGQLRALRQGSFKLHLYDQSDVGDPLETPQLYNLAEDPSEATDIASNHPDAVDMMLETIKHFDAIERRPPIFDQRFIHLAPLPTAP